MWWYTMVRKEKERKIGRTTAEQMGAGVTAVIEECYSVRNAAEMFDIKFQTLARYVKKKRENPNATIKDMGPNYSVRRVFSDDQEKQLGGYITICSKMAYGITTKECRKIAYDMAVHNNLPKPDSWTKNSFAGLEWMRHFLKRRKNISIRQPEACSLSRLTSFNPHNVNMFFNHLEELIKRKPQLADGSRIYNLDETGVSTVQNPKKILAEKGSKQVNQCTSAERGVLVTVCCIISANGTYLPPAMVFPRKYFKPHMLNGAPSSTLGLANPSGWMTGELFTQVLDHFIKYSSSTIDNPTLLIYDNHESHISVAVVEKARAAGVFILTLPPHCSHKLQPLDISVYGPFKAHYNASVDSWMLRNPGVPMTIYQVAQCVGEAHPKAITPTNIIAGFKRSGIYPLNTAIFTESDFLTSSVTDRSLESPSTSQTAAIDDKSNTNHINDDDNDNDADTEDNNPTVFVSPEIFRGFPKALPRKANRKRRRTGKSKIITDTPEKDLLLEMEKQKQENSGKKKQALIRVTRTIADPNDLERKTGKTSAPKKVKRAIQEDINESDENDKTNLEFMDTSDDENWSPEDIEEDPDYFRAAVKNDFVLVEFLNHVYYIGKIISDIDDVNEYEVTYLRKSEKLGGCFRYPDEPDIAALKKSDIKWVLPNPTPMNNKRFANYYKFNINFNNFDVR